MATTSDLQRFKNIHDDNPAPGKYDPMKTQACSGSIIGAPFGSLANRFKSDSTTTTPGPGEYFSLKHGLAYESCMRCKKNDVKVGFNSSTSRTKVRVATDGPGPDKYPLKMKWKIPRASVHHAVFKSKTKRFEHLEKVSVAPNAYDVSKAYKACHEPCKFFRCLQDAPFGSRTTRMPEVPDRTDMSVLGPGLTNMRGDISENVKGGAIARGRRFSKDVADTGPGPQMYCLHPYSASSILQRHFNVTLGKPSVLRDLQPSETSWLSRVRKKKNLRTFNKGVVQDHQFCHSHSH